MKIEFDDEFMYQLKDAVFINFLKEDLDAVRQNLASAFHPDDCHPDDVKYNKKLIKAYKRILDYYGVEDGQA